MTKETGGPAFPINSFTKSDGGIQWGKDGMTLRDWFAGMALHGLIACNPTHSHEGYKPEKAARISYALADAMLKARNDD